MAPAPSNEFVKKMAEPAANNEYVRKIRLGASHVDCFRRLKLSVLMELFQECCIAHTEELGMGRKMTLDRGFLWIIGTEIMEISRLPEYDETILLKCRPGKTMHYFFPRHMRVTDENGCTLIRMAAMWSLIDAKSRQMIDPGENGIHIEGEDHAQDLQPFIRIPARELPETVYRHADYSMLDINGHINNASYVNLAEDILGYPVLCRKNIREVRIQYKKEILHDTDFEVQWGPTQDGYCFQNDYFVMEMKLS